MIKNLERKKSDSVTTTIINSWVKEELTHFTLPVKLQTVLDGFYKWNLFSAELPVDCHSITDSPLIAPLARSPRLSLCRETERLSSQISGPFTVSLVFIFSWDLLTMNITLIVSIFWVFSLCVAVDVFSVHSHVPEGQTLRGVTAQHPGLELQLFNVSVLPLLMQQPVQQQPDSESSETTATVPDTIQLLVTAAGVHHHQLHQTQFTCWESVGSQTETYLCVCVCLYLRPSSVLLGMAYLSLSRTSPCWDCGRQLR